MKPNNYIHLAWLILVLIATGCGDPGVVENSNLKQSVDLCQFHRSECAQTVNKIDVTLKITPEHAPSEEPLMVYVNFSRPVHDVSYRLEGRDMFMGVIPGVLNHSHDNYFQGPLIYGACSSGYMVWRMFVSFTSEQGKQVAIFDFLADNEVNN